jgi:hypothetical protein
MTSAGAGNADFVDCSHLGATSSSSLVGSGIVRAGDPLRKSADGATLGARSCRYPKGLPLMPTRHSLLVLIAATAVLAGCGGGGGKSSSGSGGTGTVDTSKVNGITIGDCLNTEEDFLVQPSQTVLDGQSPAGVVFTMTLYKTNAAAQAAAKNKNPKTTAVVENGVVDFKGNPSPYKGAPPAKISKVELAAIKGCIDKAAG